MIKLLLYFIINLALNSTLNLLFAFFYKQKELVFSSTCKNISISLLTFKSKWTGFLFHLHEFISSLLTFKSKWTGFFFHLEESLHLLVNFQDKINWFSHSAAWISQSPCCLSIQNELVFTLTCLLSPCMIFLNTF